MQSGANSNQRCSYKNCQSSEGNEEIVGPHTTVSEQKDFMAIEETQQGCVQQGHVCADRKWCKLGRFSDLPKNNCLSSIALSIQKVSSNTSQRKLPWSEHFLLQLRILQHFSKIDDYSHIS